MLSRRLSAGSSAGSSVGASPLRFLVLMSLAAMFADVSYEGARGIVGPYLGFLGASATLIGFVAGLGELVGYGLRIATGWLADRSRAYFLLTGLGYAFTFGAIAGLGLVPGQGAGLYIVLGLVLLERLGKAVRSPARSQLVATAVKSLGEGKGFGLDEALDQLGAISGPLLAGLAIWFGARRGDGPVLRYQLAFLLLALPGLGNAILLWRARRQHLQLFASEAPKSAAEPLPPSTLGLPFRLYLVALALLSAAFADWALVGLHLSRSGRLPANWIPLCYAGAMAVDGVAALILGALFDRWPGRRGVLTLAIGALLSAASLPLLFFDCGALWTVGLGVALWGAAMGAQESVCKAAIARFVPSAQRAQAYGTFYALFGISWWIGSTLLGLLYDHSRLLMVAAATGGQLVAALFLGYVATAKLKTP